MDGGLSDKPETHAQGLLVWVYRQGTGQIPHFGRLDNRGKSGTSKKNRGKSVLQRKDVVYVRCRHGMGGSQTVKILAEDPYEVPGRKRRKGMRDISNYEQQYIAHPFERIQEKYRRRLVKKVISDYAQAGNSILEIGCWLEPLFTDYNDEYKFTVVEPAAHCYENACALAEKYKKVSCYKGFFEDVADSIRGGAYDIIICSSLLHEVEKPSLLLKEIARLCGHDTVVHVNVPNAFSLHRLLAREMGLIGDVHQMSESNMVLQQHSVFDMKSLTELVMSENYEVLDSGSFLLKPFTHKQMQECTDSGFLNDDILDALDKICGSYMKEYGSEIYLNMRHIDK